MTIDELSKGEKVIIWVQGMLLGLQEEGLVELRGELTPKGISLYDQLEASGYQPTAEEQRHAIEHMKTLGMVFETSLGQQVADSLEEGE